MFEDFIGKKIKIVARDGSKIIVWNCILINESLEFLEIRTFDSRKAFIRISTIDKLEMNEEDRF